MTIILTPQEKAELEYDHAHCKNVHERDRMRAVLFHSEGWSAAQIATALRIHPTTAGNYLKDYVKSKKLTDNRGGSDRKLTSEQEKVIVEYLVNVMHHDVKDIMGTVNAFFGIQYTKSGMTKWLRLQGFSYKKPKGAPKKVNEQAQIDFIQDYEYLRSLGVPIYFIDGVHPTMATKISGGWIKKGQTKEVKTNGSRSRINLMGALNLNDISSTIIQKYKTVNTESVIDFLEHLRKTSNIPCDQTIHIVLDQAGYHRSEKTKEVAKKLNIELHYLPPYCPNLNPIERLWKVMNEYARNNVFFAKKKDFEHAIMGFFSDTLPQIAHQLHTRINDNFQVIKPAF